MQPNPARGAGTRPVRRLRRALLGSAGAAAAGLLLPGRASAAHVAKPWPEGRAAPALELADLDGRAWRLAEFKGRPVLLNFWATWCEPCRLEMRSLQTLASRQAGDGLAVLSVNYQEDVEAIRRFLAITPVGLPILLDRDGAATLAWTPRVFPTTVLIDRAGAPRTSVVGDLDWSGRAAQRLIEPILAAPRP